MRISHPHSGMIVYLTQAEYDEFQVKPTDRFRVSAWLEDTKIWVKVQRGRYQHTVHPYKGNTKTPWHVRGPAVKDHEGRFRTEIDVPEFGLTEPIGCLIDDDTMLAELPDSAYLSSPANRLKKLGIKHHHSGKYGGSVQMLRSEPQEPAMVASEEVLPQQDDGRAAIKAAVDLINQLVQECGKFKFCILRDGTSARLKKGDLIKAKIVTEEDL